MTKGEQMTGIRIGDLAYRDHRGHKMMGIVVDIPWNGNAVIIAYSHNPAETRVVPLYQIFIMRNGVEYKSQYGRLQQIDRSR